MNVANLQIAWYHHPALASGAPGGAMPHHRGWFRAAYYLHEALRAAGVHVVDVPGSPAHPKIVLQFCPPHLFVPVRGKVTVLFSMYEGGALPPEVAALVRLADACVVPSQYNRSVWLQAGVEAAVVPLGVPDPYLAVDPTRSRLQTAERVLRYLFVGSALERKGWPMLLPAWAQVFRPQDKVELYIKTIGGETRAGVAPVRNIGPRIVLDQRDLSEQEMLELYLSADVFVFPSLGEGFGLPALEAMAAGCLVVAPAITGLTEFVNDLTAIPIPLSQPVVADYGAQYVARFPTVDGLAAALRRVAAGWGTPAIETIRRTGAHNARKFTWRATGEDLAGVLTAVAGKRAVPSQEAMLVH